MEKTVTHTPLFRSSIAFALLGFAFALAVSATPASLAAKELKAPGSRVRIDLPNAYQVSNLFQGFIHPVADISIFVIETPATAYGVLAASLTPEKLAKKGLIDIKKGTLARKDDYVYYTAAQNHAQGTFFRHMLLIHNKTHAALITANVPKALMDKAIVDPAHVPAALATVHLDQDAAPSNDPYAIAYLGSFKEAGRLRGQSKLYTQDGSIIPPKQGAVRNALIVAASINQLPVKDLKELAKRAWASLPGYQGLEATSEKPVTIGGLEGFQISGTATRPKPDGNGSVPLFVKHVLLKRPAGGYFRMIAIGKKADESTLAPEFEKIIASFKPIG